jgi:hypothetical protein
MRLRPKKDAQKSKFTLSLLASPGRWQRPSNDVLSCISIFKNKLTTMASTTPPLLPSPPMGASPQSAANIRKSHYLPMMLKE